MVKTTFEMDGLLTQEDIDNRYIVMGQCADCFEYSKWDTEHNKYKCSYCGNDSMAIHPSAEVSLRTYNPTLHNKKKKRK